MHDKQKHKKNELTYLSCAVFTSNELDISIRKTNDSIFPCAYACACAYALVKTSLKCSLIRLCLCQHVLTGHSNDIIISIKRMQGFDILTLSLFSSCGGRLRR